MNNPSSHRERVGAAVFFNLVPSALLLLPAVVLIDLFFLITARVGMITSE